MEDLISRHELTRELYNVALEWCASKEGISQLAINTAPTSIDQRPVSLFSSNCVNELKSHLNFPYF